MNNISRSKRQNEFVDKWVANKCNGTGIFPTGFGKTYMGLVAVKRFLDKNPGRQVLIVVPTQPLKDQWQSRVEDWGFLSFNVQVEIINTVIKNKYNIDLLIIDEVHVCAANTFREVFKVVKYQMIMCLTATLERLDGKHVIIEKYCPVIDTMTIQEAIEKNWLAPYREYKIMLDVDLTEYNTANQNFIEYFSFFDYDFTLAMACVADWRVREQYLTQLYTGSDPKQKASIRKQIIANAMGFSRTLNERKQFIYKHPKKIEIVNTILSYRTNKKAIVFSPTIDVAEQVDNSFILHSGHSKKKRRMTLEEFNELDIGVISSSKALNTGVDIPGLNLGIIHTSTSSKLTKTQSVGRVIRFSPNKEAEMFILVLRGTVDEEWARRSNTNPDIIVLDEVQLMNLLQGRPVEEKKQKQTNMLFRF